MIVFKTFGDFELLTTIIADTVKLRRLERIPRIRAMYRLISDRKPCMTGGDDNPAAYRTFFLTAALSNDC